MMMSVPGWLTALSWVWIALAVVSVATFTVLAFDIGMGGWMLLLHFTENMPATSHIAFWFLMQIGVILGTLTALPAVRWLAGQVRGEPLAA